MRSLYTAQAGIHRGCFRESGGGVGSRGSWGSWGCWGSWRYFCLLALANEMIKNKSRLILLR